jgi:hypothetical protein
MRKIFFVVFFLVNVFHITIAQAKIDLVTLPGRDKTQLTIYNSADLTLVREQRILTLKKGLNRLEFGWENTLIDPTSVKLRAPGNAGKVNLEEVSYPKGVKGSAVWTIKSELSGPVPVEITFFTSGINWHAFYMGTLSKDEQHMQLQAYVKIRNHSGEDYENATTRVIVGNIHLLDEIAELARRDAPYNRPGATPYPLTQANDELKFRAYNELDKAEESLASTVGRAKKIIKQGLSEYFLYTIEGTENIPNGWGKRLPSFDVAKIPVRNLYRYEEERYGLTTRRLIYFKNDSQHNLGTEPLPDGNIKVFRKLNKAEQLAYVGHVYSKYIPIEQEVELDFGTASEVKIEPVLMNEWTENYMFNTKGNISGFDRIQQWDIKLENDRDISVSVEVWRNLKNAFWQIKNSPDNKGNYEKVDIDSVKYTIELPPRSSMKLAYTVTLFEGDRQNRR